MSEPLRVGHPHHDRRVVGHVAEARLAFAQIARRLAPHPRHLQVGVDPGDQLARRERLGQIIVGAGVQSFDARLFAGPRGEQDHRQIAQLRVARSSRSRPKPSRPGIMTSVSSRSGFLARIAASAAWPSETVSTSHLGPKQPADIIAHVGIVVGDEDAGAVGLALQAAGRARRRLARLSRSAASAVGSQRSASST